MTMSYKTILVHVDNERNIDARLKLAIKLALAGNAHLIGMATTGVSQFLRESVAVDPIYPGMLPYLDTLQKRAEETMRKFETLVQASGLTSYEARFADDDPAIALSAQARYADLCILGQFDPGSSDRSSYANLPADVAFHGGGAVLVVPAGPNAGAAQSFGERILIGWNASKEATRAVRHALPLLKRAKVVEVVSFNPPPQPDGSGQLAAFDIATYLARHDVKVDLMQENTDADAGRAILSLATSLNCDLLVAGCYGHSRLRELVLGGATQTILKGMTVPVLMAH
jgi:nucleotide-binding universal stress UspA family protein